MIDESSDNRNLAGNRPAPIAAGLDEGTADGVTGGNWFTSPKGASAPIVLPQLRDGRRTVLMPGRDASMLHG